LLSSNTSMSAGSLVEQRGSRSAFGADTNTAANASTV
jgi:hypothetical protein